MTGPVRIAPPLPETAGTGRLPGPDVVRAVALIGVVLMNYHGYLVIRGGAQGDDLVDELFDPWTGPLSTRFASTFVLVAGVGVTLLTRRSIGDRAAVAARRLTLVRRGLVLYAGGLLLDTIWNGTILPFYGVMFAVGAALFTLASRWVLAVGLLAAVAGAGLAWLSTQRELDGGEVSWFLGGPVSGPAKWVTDMFVNGTHPLLPWLAFFCTGIVLGRVPRTDWWRRAAIGGGLILFATASLISSAVSAGPLASVLSSTDPYDRGLLYVTSALGTSLVAFGVLSWLAERFTSSVPIELLRNAGAMTLTLYVAHVVVFNLVVDWLGWIRPTGLDTALLLAGGYWVVAIAAAAWYHRRFGTGPVERVYRLLGG
ncbi:heparan-alpha-glucosaminide N-acetyltransferase domain-containing protein [soil metagenome]